LRCIIDFNCKMNVDCTILFIVIVWLKPPMLNTVCKLGHRIEMDHFGGVIISTNKDFEVDSSRPL